MLGNATHYTWPPRPDPCGTHARWFGLMYVGVPGAMKRIRVKEGLDGMGLVRRSLLGVLVVVLAAPVAVAVDLVTASDVLTTDTTLPQDGGGGGGAAQGASEAETTDTTLSGSSGDAAGSGSGGVRGASHCDGRRHRIDGTCRACPKLDEYHDGTSCVKKTKPAPKDPTCPAGQTYFSSYGGCRPSSCPHGRTSTGWCRSRPPPTTAPRTTTTTLPSCPSGQSYLAEYGGCRTTTCENCRSSEGWCRACPDPFKYHNGAMCVLKTKAAPADPACTEDDHLYYGCFEGCRPKTCPPGHGRTDDGWCKVSIRTGPTVITTVLAAPDDLVAYGHNASPAARNKASVRIDWSDVSGATRYWIRYVAWHEDYVEADDDPPLKQWHDHYVVEDEDGDLESEVILPPPPDPDDPDPDSRMFMKTPYIVRVRAMNDTGGISPWSERVYAYATTTDPSSYSRYARGSSEYIYQGVPRPGERIAAGQVRDDTEYIWDSYTYTICQNTIPGPPEEPTSTVPGPPPTGAALNRWLREIDTAISSWETATEELVTATRQDAEDCDTKTRNLSTSENVVRFSTPEKSVSKLCRRLKVDACVLGVELRITINYTIYSTIYSQNIVLDYPYYSSIEKDDRGCSTVYRGMLHESGHVYGLGDHKVEDNISVMYTTDDRFCSPTEYDILVVRAIHQSGHDYDG